MAVNSSALRPVVRIVDDDPNVLRSESFLVSMCGWQTACFPSAEDFLARDDSMHPGCLILDVRMPGMNGLELQDAMEEKGLDLPIIFLTGHGDIDMAVHALQTGASDFLVKPPEPERLKEAIEKAVALCLKRRKNAEELEKIRALYNTLTPREKTVVPLIAKDLSNKEAARILNLSDQSVKVHRRMIMEKLQVSSVIELHSLLNKLFPGEKE